MEKLNRNEMQVVVDYLTTTHEFLYETIMQGDNGVRKDELAIRKFLLVAREKGFNIDGGYRFDEKIKKLG